MSIALTGPSKYDFQDLVCIKYILQFYKIDNMSFLVEPNGGEDAELNYIDNNGQPLQFEIQVKGSEEAVTMGKVAECLGHFPAYKTTSFLLERLVSNKNSRAVLVMSGRATDSLQKFLSKGEWDGSIHRITSFNQNDASQILEAIKDYTESLPTTKMNNERKYHINKFINSVDLKDVKDSLARLIVVDNVSNDSLTDTCRRILRKDFYMPDDMFNDVMAGLATVIKEGKLSQEDVAFPFLKKLDETAVLSVRPKKYILRNQEEAWISQLKRAHALLLSGKPRVGKSNTAKWIAAKFQTLGYSVLLTQHVDEAERFLLDVVSAPRLVVLDDPLGGIHPVNKPHEKLSLLKKLIANLRPNRKLIVAQGQEKLLEVTEAETLIDATLECNAWVDLSIASNEFLLSYWDSLRGDFSISDSIFFIVRKEIGEKGLYIEPGCLAYLASEHEKIASCTDVDQILRFARRDASDLGKALAEDSCKDVLIGLAITTSHLERVQEKELAFSLTNKESRVYGYSNFSGIVTSFSGGTQNEVRIFPSYQKEPELLQKDSDSLDLLEIRRMIEFNDSNQVTFTHPFYRAAAESLITFRTRRSFPKIEKLLSNGLFCLSPITARASARNLHWVYERVRKTDEKKKIVELAKSGLNSSYPSVRDICFEFLIDILPYLDDEYKKEQSKWINKINGDNLASLEWIDGQPWYPMGERLTLEAPWISSCDKDKAIRIICDINNDTAMIISPKDAYDVLTYLKNKPEELSNSAISRILSVNEGLIRALAAKVWMKINRENDDQILERIFRDKHPAVAESIFKSAIRAWNQFSIARQNKIFNGLMKLANQPVLANAIIKDLVVFERPHLMGENPPWQVFSALLPIALSSMPPSANFNYGRLDNVINEAIRILKPDSVLPILESWITLLEKVAIYKIPDDYALSVTDTLIKITKSNVNARAGLIKRLLSINGTGTLARVISDLMSYWDDLIISEKEIVVELINADRKDKYWLKSAVLTSSKPPRELLELIIDDYSRDILHTEDILNLRPELLTTAFKMYIGEPQPLWWIGTHHREKNIWPKVIDLIAHNPSHTLFNMAFNELLFKGDRDHLCTVIYSIGEEYSEEVFELVLQYYIDSNPEFMPEVWNAIFDLASGPEICSKWIERIAFHSLNIFNDLYQARKIIPNEYLNEFYSHFTNDLLIVNTLKRIEELKDKDGEYLSKGFKEKIKPVITVLFKESSPLHYSTCDIAQNLLQNLGYSAVEVNFVQKRRDELMAKLDVDNAETKSEEIKDWIF